MEWLASRTLLHSVGNSMTMNLYLYQPTGDSCDILFTNFKIVFHAKCINKILNNKWQDMVLETFISLHTSRNP